MLGRERETIIASSMTTHRTPTRCVAESGSCSEKSCSLVFIRSNNDVKLRRRNPPPPLAHFGDLLLQPKKKERKGPGGISTHAPLFKMPVKRGNSMIRGSGHGYGGNKATKGSIIRRKSVVDPSIEEEASEKREREREREKTDYERDEDQHLRAICVPPTNPTDVTNRF